MSDRKFPTIRTTGRGLPVTRGSERRGTLFLTEISDGELLVEEIDPKTGVIIERSRLSRQAYTDDQAITVYRKTRRKSRRERE